MGDWFTTVALDGVVGGAIGGATTGLAVWWTLRGQAKSEDRRELRRAVAECRSRTFDAAMTLVNVKPRAADRATFMRSHGQAVSSSLFLVQASARRAPALRGNVEDVIDELGQGFRAGDDIAAWAEHTRIVYVAVNTHMQLWLSSATDREYAQKVPRLQELPGLQEFKKRATTPPPDVGPTG